MKFKIMLVLLALSCAMQQVYADSSGDCFDALEHDVELQPIRDKVALSGSDAQTFSMLSNENYPTSDEKQAIFKWATKREQCLNGYPMLGGRNNPINQVGIASFNSVQSLILGLYKGSITYGQFFSQRQEIGKVRDARFQQIMMQSQQQQQYQQQQYQQQQNSINEDANAYAKLTPTERAAASMYRAGAQMGKAIDRAMNK